jgi:hypothetical protein
MVLVFQTDSAICTNSKRRIADFFKFSYLGAPWYHLRPELTAGNGGFSLRNQTTMRAVVAARDWGEERLPEDVYFAEAVAEMAAAGTPGVRYPSLADARSFALETYEDIVTAEPGDVYGVHTLYFSPPLTRGALLHKLARVCPDAIVPLYHRCVSGYSDRRVGAVTEALAHSDARPL